jgi:pimeloyl-ACP methyl ester carboxylesterase
VVTEDGVVLWCRRYHNPGGPPVILLHGMGQNLLGWDHDLPGRSLARHLAGLGHDVWLANFRGHGRRPLRSESPASPAVIEDYACRDLPALVAAVRARTGLRPALVGHGLGGVAVLLYLGGVMQESTWVTRRLSWRRSARVPQPRLRIARDRAALRNAAVSGAVLVGTPVDFSGAPVIRVLSPLLGSLLQRVLAAAPFTSWGSVRAAAGGRGARGWLGRLFTLLHQGTAESVTRLGRTRLADLIWFTGNMDLPTIRAELDETLDDVSPRVLRQFEDWYARGTMREADHGDRDRFPLELDRCVELVSAPVLFLVGDRDPWAPPDAARRCVRRMVGAARVEILAGFGHNDLRVGVRAPDESFPRIARFLAMSALPQDQRPVLEGRQATLLEGAPGVR